MGRDRAERLKAAADRLVVVANRLPVTVAKQEQEWTVRPGSGGLVTALAPVLRNRNGLWCGWSGTTEEEEAPLEGLFGEAEKQAGFRLLPVTLSKEEVELFYLGFSNETLWPLFHDLLGRTHFEKTYWESYLKANQRYASTLSGAIDSASPIWVHDYHLIPLGGRLREGGHIGRIGFFLHIPFPTSDLFRRLPWRRQLIEFFLAYDLVGFQTRRDFANFIHCVREMLPDVQIFPGSSHYTILLRGRRILVQHFPISIDFQEFNRLAKFPSTQEAAAIFQDKYPDQKIILGLDRLDYTKGVVPRFRAFQTCLKKYPDLRGKVVLVQVVVPSRIEVPEYQAMKRELEQLLAQINGEFTRPGWVPIHYFFRSLSRLELAAMYRAADIALVTPIRDGMNLVSKEYCASSPDGGVLILSEFAGAAEQLREGAILVNPFDLDGVADAIYGAFHMPMEEQLRRMNHLRNHLRQKNVYEWVNGFLAALQEGQVPAASRSA
ncbi:MAG: trehalose-6-phosphate synthase [Myxococcales bacterium]|nr:MAG: trehalose-6-phosphate synthase [Myxococcales bacterium]